MMDKRADEGTRTHTRACDGLLSSFTCLMISFYSYVELSDCKCIFCKCHLQYLGEEEEKMLTNQSKILLGVLFIHIYTFHYKRGR